MHVRRTGTHVEVQSPAKINLFLEVLARRADGFHEIETLMTAVTIRDTLVFAPREQEGIEFECRWAMGLDAQAVARRLRQSHAGSADDFNNVPAGADNLAWRAIELLCQRSGERRGAKLTLLKRIDVAAGLGGASSDAAAALVAGNVGWDLNCPQEQLTALAAELGSDVPFFLNRGAAVCRGRGERIELVPSARLHVVVVRPPVGLSTSEVYRQCQPATQPARVESIARALATGNPAEVAKHLANRLQEPAGKLTAWIARLEEEFERLDCLGQQMSGSGSSYFGICKSARHARRVASRLRARRLGMVYAAATAAA